MHHFWAFWWILFPLAMMGTGVIHRWMKLKERQIELASEGAAEKAAQYAARSERLEQRVAVLERILTDRSQHLSDEIERLRDRPLN